MFIWCMHGIDCFRFETESPTFISTMCEITKYKLSNKFQIRNAKLINIPKIQIEYKQKVIHIKWQTIYISYIQSKLCNQNKSNVIPQWLLTKNRHIILFCSSLIWMRISKSICGFIYAVSVSVVDVNYVLDAGWSVCFLLYFVLIGCCEQAIVLPYFSIVIIIWAFFCKFQPQNENCANISLDFGDFGFEKSRIENKSEGKSESPSNEYAIERERARVWESENSIPLDEWFKEIEIYTVLVDNSLDNIKRIVLGAVWDAERKTGHRKEIETMFHSSK